MNRPRRLPLALLLFAALAGCGGKTSTTSPAPLQDAIVINNILPAQGTTLKSGTTVTFQVTTSYRLISTGTGTVTLAIQDAVGNVLPNGLASVNVVTGEATTNLTATIVVPSGASLIQVTCSLNPTGNPNQITQTSINYSVTS